MMLAMSMQDSLMVAGIVVGTQLLAFLFGMWLTRKHPLDKL